MDIKQIEYFLNLTETLNFTEAAQRSGVAQPSLTRAIQRLEEELGGTLLYRDGKDSRLSALGRDVQAEFMRIASALENVREHAENSVQGRKRVFDIGVGSTVSPASFPAFFAMVQDQLPSVDVNIHSLSAGQGIADLLSGMYHAIILPRPPKEHQKVASQKLFNERFMLAMNKNHPLAAAQEIHPDALIDWPYIDRLACEFHSEITEHLMRRDIVTHPRFRSEREDWVGQMIVDSQAICIMPERSGLQAGLALRPVTGMNLSRDVSFATVFGAGMPMELRQITRLAGQFDWSMPTGR